jgi:hypothetical protein
MIGHFPSPDFGEEVQCEDIPADQIMAIFNTNFTADVPAGTGACGGSVRAQEAWLDVRSSHFAGTSGCSKGAGLGAEYSTVSISDSSFKDLSGTGDSGGAFLYGCLSWIARSSFTNCIAEGAVGGAVAAADGTGLYITSSQFRNCSAKTGGGGIFFQLMSEEPEKPPLFTLHNSSMVECRATREGGAFTTDQVEVEISDTVFNRCEVRRWAVGAAAQVVVSFEGVAPAVLAAVGTAAGRQSCAMQYCTAAVQLAVFSRASEDA